MKPRKTAYVMHRWLGLIVSLQLLAWSTGGFIFSVLSLDGVRGKRDIAAAPFVPMSASSLGHLPELIRKPLAELQNTGADIATIAIQDRGLGPFWEARDTNGVIIVLLDPDTGEAVSRLLPEQAASLALRDFAHPVVETEVRLIESNPPTEYRKGVLPAYEVTLDHAKRPHIFIDARTGEITARRNRSWRVFDFFWMLHTMDYSGRDDFNHPLLTAFSLLAILTSGSGLTLWGWRTLHRLRSRATRRALPFFG